MMRDGGHGHALADGFDAVRPDCGGPVFVPIFLEEQFRFAKRQFGAVPLGQDGMGIGQLRHGEMKAFMPAVVFTGWQARQVCDDV